MNWAFLPKEFNATAFKGWSIVLLWIFTGLVWGVCSLAHIAIDNTAFATWVTSLTAYSAVGAFSAKNYRETDYGYVERKGASNVPASVTTVQPGAVNVAANQEVMK